MKKLILLCILVISCRENPNKVEDIITPNETSYTLNINHLFDSDPLVFEDKHYFNQAGNDITISRLRYFISKISFESNDGEIITFEDDYFLIDPKSNKNQLNLKNIKEGNYKNISFNIGLDSLTNHSDPNKYSADSPLSLINHNLHWGWASGYIFFSLEGNIHYQGNFQSFAYHIGFLKNLHRVSINSNFDVVNNESLDLEFDLAKLFHSPNTIDQSMEFMVTHSTQDNGLAERLTQNMENIFKLKE